MASASKIIVTGAAQGIGRAAALRMAAPGVHVAVWDTQPDGAEETAKLCRAAGAVSRAWQVDVGAEDQVEGAVADFEREWGKPDGLVNNAGIFPRAHALDMQLSEWEQVLRVNLTGTFLCARAAARAMKEAGGGAIVNMASGRALAGAANGRALFGDQGRHHRTDEVIGAGLGSPRHPGELRHSRPDRHRATARRNEPTSRSMRWASACRSAGWDSRRISPL